MPFFQDVLGAVVRGTCASGIEHVLASTGGPTEVDGMPQQARVVPWVDQREVLIDARVLVCHGGAGTVLAGLTAGVPLVVVPLFADQFANAERVEAVGAGVRVDLGPELDARVRDAVERALPLQSAVSDEIAELPTAESAVPWFDELADG